jgi:7-cyano-7-deazaguanine synthase
MDSLVTAAISLEESDPSFLHVSYGQRTERRELRAFREIADHYGIRRRLETDISYLKKIGGTALIDPHIPLRENGLEDGDVPASYVPFRNAHLLAIAVSWAEVMGASRIYIGAVEEDSSGYPDCRESFFRTFEEAVRLGASNASSLRLLTPLIHHTKEEIVRAGLRRNAPFHLSWSCYQEEEIACGVCDSCRLRLAAFAACGIDDPLPYRGKPDRTNRSNV